MALALPVGPLIHHQGVEPGLPRQLIAAAEVPEGMAPVAVHLDLKGSAVLHMIIAPVEPQPVPGADPDLLPREGLHGADQVVHGLVVRGIGLAVGTHIGVVLPLVGRIIGKAIGAVGDGQAEKQQRQKAP